MFLCVIDFVEMVNWVGFAKTLHTVRERERGMGVYLEFRDLGRCWATWGELFNYQSSNRYQLINIDYIVLASDSNELKFSFIILPMGATQVPTLKHNNYSVKKKKKHNNYRTLVQ